MIRTTFAAAALAAVAMSGPASANDNLRQQMDAGKLLGIADRCALSINEDAIMEWMRSQPDSDTSAISTIEMTRDVERHRWDEQTDLEKRLKCEAMAKTARHYGWISD